MKKFYAILCLAIASLTQLQAQAPQGFNYQATVRNSSGDLILNTNVYFKFNVIQGSQTAVPIFTETHYVPTDDLGQVNLVIGQGTANTGIFSELDWSLGSYYLGIELDTGNGYVAMGTTQLLSVPYALYAENSGNSTPTTPNLEAVLVENNSANNQQIKDLQDPTEAQDAATKAYVDTEVLNNVQNIEQVLTQGNDANGLQLKGIADPTDAQDAATKAYVDTEVLNNVQNIEQVLTQGNDANGLQLKGIADPTEAQDAVTLAYITQLETSLQDLQNQLQEQNQNIDNDFDGFSENNGDCDDTNAQVYSGAEEICDGLDNDCDGLVDEDAGSIFYQDSDGDGFGGSTTLQSCTQPSGYVVQGGDCNDSDATINPSAAEVCDGIDNNCDGVVDENPVDGTTWYVDSDSDGYGFIQISVVACSQPDGYVANRDDCDDNNAQVNPGATEMEDGIDNDCDGEVDDGFDIDGDGYTVGQGDCDDYDAQVNPGATEIEDGIDNDCDGEIDEGFNESGTVTDQDGNTYDYLTYGDQVWAVENAEMVTYRDGTPIPEVTDPTQWSNLTTGAWCYYDNDPTKHRLYNYYAVIGVHDNDPNTPNKEFAPEGWHVNTFNDWYYLQDYLITNGYNYDGTTTGNKIAKAMASTTGWPSGSSPGSPWYNQSSNNSSGFNAFPLGVRDNIDGSFVLGGGYTYLWAFYEDTLAASNTNADFFLLNANNHLSNGLYSKRAGFSVRFVRDSDVDDQNDVDNDGDGFTENEGDCDDNNAQVKPGATEIEDGIDNDCDGEIDEGFNESGTVTDQDGNNYNFAIYGDQVWTVKNAEMVTYRDGTSIPQVTDATEWQNLTTGAWSYYNNDPTKPRLYNWYAVMGIHDTDPNTPNKEFAPWGWHVSTDAEWTTLENYLIASGYNYDGTTTGNKIAKAMASNTGWNSSANTGAIGNELSLNNDSDFNAFPVGYRFMDGLFNFVGDYAVFWSSSVYDANDALYRFLVSNDSGLGSGLNNSKQNGFSVRFVRD